ncbi:hypothetical protein [Streptomyces sp. G45]|uniref:hypothetical protein n=1 Tax=Streptomyces sp. G45 TaxID=3406627 RepID=UPI003C259CAB
MPDRSLRRTPPSVRPLLREGRPGSSSQAPEGSQGTQDDNPFAPPPEGAPEQPWQPRRPANGGDGSGDGGDGDQGGQGGQGGSPWGSQWSDQQPGRSSGGFGERPRSQGPDGPGSGPGGGQGGLRWDPTDPAQRRARYALLSGMWGFFFALFGWRYVALLLGALGLYWGISALRGKPRGDAPGSGARPQTTAAISGLVTASLALVMVLATFGAQLVYRDYYTCRDDALTNESKQSCEDLLPSQLRPLLTDRD